MACHAYKRILRRESKGHRKYGYHFHPLGIQILLGKDLFHKDLEYSNKDATENNYSINDFILHEEKISRHYFHLLRHEVPLPMKPDLQAHVKPPFVLMQLALEWQLWV